MNVVVFSPHPDDEAIGLGGTIIEHAAEGDAVHTIFLTSGERGIPGDEEVDEVRARREYEAGQASQILETKSMAFWRESDGGTSPSTQLVRRLADELVMLGADRLYAPHRDEAHRDHWAASCIAQAAARLVLVECLTYEVWTPLREFEVALDISEHIDRKCAAIRAHQSQVELVAFDEAARSLARYRGELHNRPHGPYAEVFGRL